VSTALGRFYVCYLMNFYGEHRITSNVDGLLPSWILWFIRLATELVLKTDLFLLTKSQTGTVAN